MAFVLIASSMTADTNCMTSKQTDQLSLYKASTDLSWPTKKLAWAPKSKMAAVYKLLFPVLYEGRYIASFQFRSDVIHDVSHGHRID